MSRVAKMPITLPKGVEVTVGATEIIVKGGKGTLKQARPAGVDCRLEDDRVLVAPQSPDHDAMAGTLRAVLANLVTGVSQGFERKLELVGVGYRATMQGKDLSLNLGFSHPIVFKVPEGIIVETPTQTEILVKGSDRQLVGQVAAKIRGFRPPEPYKGKGVRYAGENIVMKEAKKA